MSSFSFGSLAPPQSKSGQGLVHDAGMQDPANNNRQFMVYQIPAPGGGSNFGIWDFKNPGAPVGGLIYPNPADAHNFALSLEPINPWAKRQR